MPKNQEQIKKEILNASIKLAINGWTSSILREASKKCRLPAHTAELVFTEGAPELIAHWHSSLDAECTATIGSDIQGIGKRISGLFEIRCQLIEPHKEAMKNAVTFMSLPSNILLKEKLTWNTVNAFWLATNKSLDFSYYTKRFSLFMIYKASMLFWLFSEEAKVSDAVAFFNRRVKELYQISQCLPRI